LDAFADDDRREDEDGEGRSPAERFLERMREVGAEAGRVALAAAGLTPVFFAAFLTLDLPVGWFDGFARSTPALQPSLWLSAGDIWMSIGLLALFLPTRRRGAQEGMRVAFAAWAAAIVLTVIQLSALAPVLGPGDLPGARFVVGFALSWIAGQAAAVAVYDLTRGRDWWRAPLYGALWGFYVQAVAYFVLVYAGTGAPWMNWIAADMMIKTGLAALFLPVYRLFRSSFRPVAGLGG